MNQLTIVWELAHYSVYRHETKARVLIDYSVALADMLTFGMLLLRIELFKFPCIWSVFTLDYRLKCFLMFGNDTITGGNNHLVVGMKLSLV